MAEVLVGQSYFLRLDPKLWEAMQPYPPLGSLYAAAWLRRAGFGVAFFDAMLSRGPEEWDQALRRHQPRFAVLCEDSFNYLSKMCLLRMRQAALEMVAMAKRRGCTVIVSGSDAADRFPLYLAGGADFVVIGEAEITLGELLASLTGRLDTPIERIQGVRAASLGPETFRPRGYLSDLDMLPFPAWDLVDMDRYRDLWRKRHGYFSLNLVTTRGCPYGCNWCAKPVHGRRYHCRSPENVVAELQWLRETAGPDHIWFADDIFGLKPGWIRRFSDLVRARGLQTPFKCLLRTDLVTAEIAADLRRAGCRTVWMGAESGSQKILDAMEKSATIEDTVRATALLREAGIEVGYFLQFGYPGEDWDDIQATFRLVRENLPDDIGVSVSYPLPGTPFFERVRSQLGVQQNWLDSNDLAMLYRGRYSSEFYRQLHRTLHREFRARRALIRLRQGEWRALHSLASAVRLPLDRWRLRRLRSSPPDSIWSQAEPKRSSTFRR
jgi:anaerobic magnesium-protoporphyrin IX monomethyl ester cyclase